MTLLTDERSESYAVLLSDPQGRSEFRANKPSTTCSLRRAVWRYARRLPIEFFAVSWRAFRTFEIVLNLRLSSWICS